MGRINIDLPDELHTELKVEAAKRDLTLKEYVTNALADDVDVPL